MFYTIKTFVIGYQGWNTTKSFLENYNAAGNETGWLTPDLVYQPNFCIVKRINLGDPFENFKNYNSFSPKIVGITNENPFAIFFMQLLQIILNRTGGLRASVPGLNAEMYSDLNQYFSIPPSKFDIHIFP